MLSSDTRVLQGRRSCVLALSHKPFVASCNPGPLLACTNFYHVCMLMLPRRVGRKWPFSRYVKSSESLLRALCGILETALCSTHLSEIVSSVMDFTRCHGHPVASFVNEITRYRVGFMVRLFYFRTSIRNLYVNW